MTKQKKTVCLMLRGCVYSYTVYECHTLKAAMERLGIKRSHIINWWKEYKRKIITYCTC